MAIVAPVTDGNTYAPKTADTPPVEPGEEVLRWAMADANNLRTYLGLLAAAVNANAGVDVQAPFTGEELVISDAINGQHIPLDPTTDPMTLEIPAALLSPGTAATFVVLNLTNPITVVTTGPTGFETSYYGKSTPDAIGDTITVIMESTTRARVTIAARTSVVINP